MTESPRILPHHSLLQQTRANNQHKNPASLHPQLSISPRQNSLHVSGNNTADFVLATNVPELRRPLVVTTATCYSGATEMGYRVIFPDFAIPKAQDNDAARVPFHIIDSFWGTGGSET